MNVGSCFVYALDKHLNELVDLHPIVIYVTDLESIVKENVS